MDFDPGFFSEDNIDDAYEEGFEDASEDLDEQEEPEEPEVEYDSLGNPIFLGMAAGFGAQMAEEEMDERQLAKDILDRREGKKGEPIKVPLSHRRNKKKGHMTPFARWATKVNIDPDRRNDEIEYTPEEWRKIMRHEAGMDDE